MQRRDLLILAPLAALAAAAARAAEPIKPFALVCPEFPPYSVEKGPQAPGLLVELLQLLGQELGLELQPQYYPFARASLLAQRGPRTVIAPLARTPGRESQYRWLLPLFTQRYVLLARAERWPALQALPSLREQRVAALRGSVSTLRLRALHYLNISEEGSYEHLLRRLDEGSADLIYGSQPLFIGGLRSSGRALRDYQLGPMLDELGVWLAGSQDFDEADAQALRVAMERLRRNGAYSRFLQKADLTTDIIGNR